MNFLSLLFLFLLMISSLLMTIYVTQPQIIVKDGKVISVDGEPTYRNLGKWDFLEGDIQKMESPES